MTRNRYDGQHSLTDPDSNAMPKLILHIQRLICSGEISIAVNIKPPSKLSMSAERIITLVSCVFTVSNHSGAIEENEIIDVETGFE